MAKNPEDRYASARELARAADEALSARSPAVKPAEARVPAAGGERTVIAPTVIPEQEASPQPVTAPAPVTPVPIPADAAERLQQPSPAAAPAPSRPRLKRRTTLYAAVAALVVALAAGAAFLITGSGAKQSPMTPTRHASTHSQNSLTTAALSLTAYRAQLANIINIDLEDAIAQVPNWSTFGEPSFSRLARQEATALTGVAARLASLNPPPQLRINHQALVTVLDEVPAAWRDAAAASDSDNVQAGTRAYDDGNEEYVTFYNLADVLLGRTSGGQ